MDRYTVADWQAAAYEIIDDIVRRGKQPIIVGGTGLYIAALLKGYIFSEHVPRDENNPRHAISAYQEMHPPEWEVLTLGIDLPREKLYQRIDERVDRRMKDGMIEESRELLAGGVTIERLRKLGLEYRFMADFIENMFGTKEEMTQKLKYAIHAYARRQLTWFRGQTDAHWITNEEEAETLVQNFLA